MTIRELQVTDIPTIKKIIATNYSDEYANLAEKDMLLSFSLSHSIKPHFFVATENESVVGVVGYSQSMMDFHNYEMFWLNVDSTYQKKGIGKSLVERVLTEATKHKGRLLIISTTLPEFYAQWNFKICEKVGVYSLMTKKLSA